MKNILLAAAAFAATGSPATAAVILDQNALNPPGLYGGNPVTSSASPYGYREAGQTITAGISGLLSRVDLMIGGESAYAMRLSIRPLVSGVVDPSNANRLATFDLIAPSWGPNITYQVTSIDVSSVNLVYAAGQQFAITLENLGGFNGLGGWAVSSRGYAGGTGLGRPSATATWQQTSDLAFATYVDTGAGAIPEPATWALLITGFGVIGASARRRKRAPLAA